MKEQFANILSDYSEAYGQNFTNHPMAKIITKTLPKLILGVITEKERYFIKGSAGAGNWSSTPWIGIFDVLITSTAQSGYYPVFYSEMICPGFIYP